MLTPKTIILPVDFSTRAAATAAHARVMAKQFDATIVALHVMRPFQLAAEGVDVPSAAVLDWYTQQKPLLESQLEEFARIYLTGCKVKTIFREGEPASEIIRAANEEKADLIMLSTHGYGPFRRFLLGSVAAKVLNDSHVPVLTGTHIDVPAGETEQIRSIVVAVELDARASKLIAAGNSLAKAFGAELHVVHASPDDGAGVAQYMDPAWRVEVAHQMKTRLEEAVTTAAAAATIHVIPGEAAKVVRQVAEDVKADLVVLGRHLDHSFLGRLRTHSYAIVREAGCPVLSL
jgi:nucleotide-binding universal stress UspA family protein